jgi:hypothetical protein
MNSKRVVGEYLLTALVALNAQSAVAHEWIGTPRARHSSNTCFDPVFARYAPYAPLDVDAFVRPKQNRVVVTWNAPDQSGYRQIVRFEIERVDRHDYEEWASRRASPPPILLEGQIPGPNGNQSPDTKLSFSFVSSALKYPTAWGFRVCSANDVGRACPNNFVWVYEKPFNVFDLPSSVRVTLPRPNAAREVERRNAQH